MRLKTLSLFLTLLSQNIFAYSTLDCASTDNLTYLSHNKVGGAAPYPGMITHIEEIKQNNELIYRVVHREPCYDNNFCHIQQPELIDIVPKDFTFQFLETSKVILASEGNGTAPIQKETYAVKFVLKKEFWMICESFLAFYP